LHTGSYAHWAAAGVALRLASSPASVTKEAQATIMSQTDIEAAVGQEIQQEHWLLLDDQLKREWTVLDASAGLSADVLTYVSPL
jgi:hypothetical protein